LLLNVSFLFLVVISFSGHGFLSDKFEARDLYLRQTANTHGYIIVATDWLGLTKEDFAVVALMLATDLTNFRIVPDRCRQGFVTALIAMRLLRDSRFLAEPAMQINGVPVSTPSTPRY
jgi:hypothetical protein